MHTSKGSLSISERVTARGQEHKIWIPDPLVITAEGCNNQGAENDGGSGFRLRQEDKLENDGAGRRKPPARATGATGAARRIALLENYSQPYGNQHTNTDNHPATVESRHPFE